MDSVALIKPASGGNAAQYGYVDKRPSILPWELKPQSEWMNSAQKTWVLPYAILTLIAISLAIIMWIVESVYTKTKRFFCKEKKSSDAETSTTLFSELQGVQVYLPVHNSDPNVYFTVNTDGMLLRHLEDSVKIKQDDSNFELVELVPLEFRNKVLGTIKWYSTDGDAMEEGASTAKMEAKITLYKKKSFKAYESDLNDDSPNNEVKAEEPQTTEIHQNTPKKDIIAESAINTSNAVTPKKSHVSIEEPHLHVSKNATPIANTNIHTQSDSMFATPDSKISTHTPKSSGSKQSKSIGKSLSLSTSLSENRMEPAQPKPYSLPPIKGAKDSKVVPM